MLGSLVMAQSASNVVPMEPVTLIASDGSVIILDRRAAMVSGTIKSMLAGPGALPCHKLKWPLLIAPDRSRTWLPRLTERSGRTHARAS